MPAPHHLPTLRLAEDVVRAMLQRAGARFFHIGHGPADQADALFVQHGSALLALDVRYADQPDDAVTLWHDWMAAHPPTAAPLHLVVVSSHGGRIFADRTIAPLLAADPRTTLYVLDTGSAPGTSLQ